MAEIPWHKGQNGNYRALYPQSSYDPTQTERACHTVDIAICRLRDAELQVLLIRRKADPYGGCWAIPGGFVDILGSEGIEDAAYRELAEETGLSGIPIRELGTFGAPARDPRWRVISTVYYALVSETLIDKTIADVASDGRQYGWFNLGDLPELAFDHKQILAALCERLRELAEYQPLAMELLPELFTWSDLQVAYEVLLAKPLVASNFRRDIRFEYRIEETGLKESPKPGRKGRLGVLCRYLGPKQRYI